jgi:hypothetical protein
MDWATIIPVLVGSFVALASSVSVEYLKSKQAGRAAVREREDTLRRQSREEFHTLVTRVQDSLQEMILLAHKIVSSTPGDRQEAAELRASFREAAIGCVRLVSRLPANEWRDAVSEVMKLTNRAIAAHDEGAPEEDEVWANATTTYEQVVGRLAQPLQEFYALALSSVRP